MSTDDPCIVVRKWKALSCALWTKLSKVKCWGICYSGGCGTGDQDTRGDVIGEMGTNLPFIDLGDFPVVSISVGLEFACALSDFGAVKCWGYNSFGQLGQSDRIYRGSSPGQMGSNLPEIDLNGGYVMQLASGGYHTCVLLEDGGVKCWGFGYFGALGYGSNYNVGEYGYQMGRYLAWVDTGEATTSVMSVQSGRGQTCAVISNGDVKCWGQNYGVLGYGDTTNRGENANHMGSYLPALDLGYPATLVSISVGAYFVCALSESGRVKCWGANYAGQLGQGDTTARGESPGQMGSNLPDVDVGGGLVVQLSVGSMHTCVLLEDNSVKCWGSGNYGQLGYGSKSSLGTSAEDMGDNLHVVDVGGTATSSVVALAGGYYNQCAVLSNGDVKCWGYNEWGVLGLGDEISRGRGGNTMGSYLPAVDLGEDTTCPVTTTSTTPEPTTTTSTTPEPTTTTST
ncbi:regulator of chromosome condensation 1/beta-lactamase-inhibitor protein II, partial [Baffinella frigidus]